MTNAKGMPTRTFGKTGEQISILGYGCGSQFMKMPDGEWEKSIEHAYNSGVNYFDTAAIYGSDEMPSEVRVGKVLPAIRKDVLLLTKIMERDPDKGMAQFERSLKRLNTDYVDFLLIHSIQPDDDVAELERGIYTVLRKIKDQKMARYIGFSSMDSAERSRELIDKLEFDLTLLAMNATKYGNFVDTVLPAARDKNLGIISMKVMRNSVGNGANPAELLEYNWNLPGVACNLVSHTGMPPLVENIQAAKDYTRRYTSLTQPEELESRLAHMAGPHALDWARPGYFDGMMC
jgi:predicted aldo/keto reductase-like oxidoreductase